MLKHAWSDETNCNGSSAQSTAILIQWCCKSNNTAFGCTCLNSNHPVSFACPHTLTATFIQSVNKEVTWQYAQIPLRLRYWLCVRPPLALLFQRRVCRSCETWGRAESRKGQCEWEVLLMLTTSTHTEGISKSSRLATETSKSQLSFSHAFSSERTEEERDSKWRWCSQEPGVCDSLLSCSKYLETANGPWRQINLGSGTGRTQTVAHSTQTRFKCVTKYFYCKFLMASFSVISWWLDEMTVKKYFYDLSQLFLLLSNQLR